MGIAVGQSQDFVKRTTAPADITAIVVSDGDCDLSPLLTPLLATAPLLTTATLSLSVASPPTCTGRELVLCLRKNIIRCSYGEYFRVCIFILICLLSTHILPRCYCRLGAVSRRFSNLTSKILKYTVNPSSWCNNYIFSARV
jgi:hypothetical protein